MTPLETAWQEFVERNPSVWSAHQESNQPKVAAQYGDIRHAWEAGYAAGAGYALERFTQRIFVSGGGSAGGTSGWVQVRDE